MARPYSGVAPAVDFRYDGPVKQKLSSPTVIRQALAEMGHTPTKRLGQNFLASGHVVAKICALLAPLEDAPVLEIGPGLGALSEGLLEAGARLTAVEIDAHFAPWLRLTFAGQPFQLVQADALKVDWTALFSESGKVKMASNIPYQVSGPLLSRILMGPFPAAAVMVQREVAERLVAPLGSRQRGVLTVVAQAAWEVKRAFDVPPSAFIPRPKVVSSVLSLRRVRPGPDKAWAAFVRRLFGYRRKMIRRALQEAFGLDAAAAAAMAATAGIDATARPESLTVDEFQRLFLAGGQGDVVQEPHERDR